MPDCSAPSTSLVCDGHGTCGPASYCICDPPYVVPYCERPWTDFSAAVVAYQAVFLTLFSLQLCLALWTAAQLAYSSLPQRPPAGTAGHTGSSAKRSLPRTNFAICLLLAAGAVCRIIESVDPLCSQGLVSYRQRLAQAMLAYPAVLTGIAVFERQFLEIQARFLPQTRRYIRLLDALTVLFDVLYWSLWVYLDESGAYSTSPLILATILLNVVVLLLFNLVYSLRVLRSTIAMATPGSDYHTSASRLYHAIRVTMLVVLVGALAACLTQLIVPVLDAAEYLLSIGVGRFVEWAGCVVVLVVILRGARRRAQEVWPAGATSSTDVAAGSPPRQHRASPAPAAADSAGSAPTPQPVG